MWGSYLRFDRLLHMAAPWNDWWHTIVTFKGNWLRGDPRGWRSRHHREHVDGDYKHPPPTGKCDEIAKRSRTLMTTTAVNLDWDARVQLCDLYFNALRFYGADVEDVAMGATHGHALVRFRAAGVPVTGVAGLCAEHHFKDGDLRDPLPRYVLGKVHSWCTRKMKEWESQRLQSPPSPEGGRPGEALRPSHTQPRHRSAWALTAGGLFAPRPKCVPIEDEAHFLFVKNEYIPGHAAEGAAVHSLLKQLNTHGIGAQPQQAPM